MSARDIEALKAEHLRYHLTDGYWHDDCRFCLQRRVHGGNGMEDPPPSLPPAVPRVRVCLAHLEPDPCDTCAACIAGGL